MMTPTNTIRVRFAPSPTGRLHVGNLRTALYNWLFARGQGGRFILRIEDTDRQRSRPEYEQQIIEDLRWVGLDWDEGPDVGGEYGPYRQSERRDLYNQYANRLLERGRAYPCFCTPEELDAERQQAKAAASLYTYSGKCRLLSEDEVNRRKARGQPFTIRFKSRSGQVWWDDAVRGRVDWQAELLGDFVIMKSDGWPVYNFAVVVDDACMKITHVIRGDGHLSNTPRQLLLYEALGAAPPRFGHLSTILGPDGAKLSKRHGATSVAEFQDRGYLPEALLNFLALLGWAPETGKEILSRQELVDQFSLQRVVKAPAIFDVGKLNWVNRNYIKRADVARLVELVSGYLRRAGRLTDAPLAGAHRHWLGLVVSVVQSRLDTLSQVVPETDVVFEFDLDRPEALDEVRRLLADPPALEVVRAFRDRWESMLAQPDVQRATEKVRRWSESNIGAAAVTSREPEGEIIRDIRSFEEAMRDAFQQVTREVKRVTGRKGKALFHPLRVALTARPSGPELLTLVPIYELGSRLGMAVMGVLERLQLFLDRADPSSPISDHIGGQSERA